LLGGCHGLFGRGGCQIEIFQSNYLSGDQPIRYVWVIVLIGKFK